MADGFDRPEETTASRREREENAKLIANLSSLSGQYKKAVDQQKLLLPKLILQGRALQSQIGSIRAQIANEAILLKLTQDKIVSAQQELALRQQQNGLLNSELESKKKSLIDADVQLKLSKMQQDAALAELAVSEQKLNVAKEMLAAKEAGRGVTESELQRVQEQLTVQVNADILAGKGASESQKELARRKYELIDALGMYNTAIQDAQQNVNQLTDESFNTQRKLVEYNRYVDEATTSVNQLQNEISNLQKTIAKNDQALEKLPLEIQNLESNVGKLSDSMAAKENEITQLKLGFVAKSFKEVGDALIKLRDKIYDIQQQLGTTFGTAINVAAGALVNRVTSFFSGGPILSFQETIDAVNAFQQQFGGILTRGEAQKIAQASKTLGVSAEVFLRAQRSFLTAGADATKTSFITQFRAAGLTAAQALKFAADNANLVAIAGSKYADALARAAANAQRIGVGLDRTEALADGIVGDFEGALERFSELRAMGVEVDFNRLSAVAGTGTPEEVQRELSSQLGGNQNLLTELQRNRFLKVALERDLGLNVAEIQRLAAGPGAVAGEQTQEEKDRTTRDKILERVGTVISSIGTLVGGIATLGAFTTANTIATNANTVALGGQGAGILSKIKGITTPTSALGKAGMVGGGAALGIGSVMGGAALVNQGKTKTGIGLGALGGGLGLALALAPFTGGLSLAALAGGAVLGGGLSYGLGKAMASGGLITGPGTATSDNILTPTSPGEFVVNAKATKMYGMSMLDNINKGTYKQPEAPAVNNVVNVNMDKMEAKLDKLAAAFAGMKIDLDGNTVGRVSLNARSPLDRLSVVG